MQMRFECGACGRMLEVDGELAGRRVRCPACRTIAEAPAADVPEVQPIDDIEEIRPIRAPRGRPAVSRFGNLAVAAGSLLYAAGLHVLILATFVMAWNRMHDEAAPVAGDSRESGTALVQPRKKAWGTREQAARNACRERLGAVVRAIDLWKSGHGSWPRSLGEVIQDPPYGSCRAEYEEFEEISEVSARKVRQVSCPEHHIRIEFGAERIGRG
ncbi:MAG: hypothetical protein HYY18_21165 [Planctomycetes bacterium]|nr:hypothetical protein [Planctomycetota bacterium]